MSTAGRQSVHRMEAGCITEADRVTEVVYRRETGAINRREAEPVYRRETGCLLEGRQEGYRWEGEGVYRQEIRCLQKGERVSTGERQSGYWRKIGSFYQSETSRPRVSTKERQGVYRRETVYLNQI